ncbi:MAG: Dabb family protein [Armatimonadota bacterium]|nr:Dabb family protein [Armatimonadota bacterium]
MIRHVVFFRFNEDAPEEGRKGMADGLGALPGKISQIKGWSQGFNTVPSDRNYDFCLIADFATAEDLKLYGDHPAHQEVVTEWVRPFVASVAAVDFSS